MSNSIFHEQPSYQRNPNVQHDANLIKPFDDPVNHPNHYISDTGLEVIDVIEAFTGDLDGFEAYCTGNIIKYICRWKHKNGVEDLKKARWYIDDLIKQEEANGNNS